MINSAAKQIVSEENSSSASRDVGHTHYQLVASAGVRIYYEQKWQEDASSQAFQVCSI